MAAAKAMATAQPSAAANAPVGASSPLGESNSKNHRSGAARPGGHDPEQLNRADYDERAPRIDECWQPIGHAQLEPAMVRVRSARSIGEQCQSIEHMQNASQQLRCLIREQPKRWRAGWQSQQR